MARRLAFAAATIMSAALLSGVAGSARADAYYEFHTSGTFFGSGEFIYDAPSLITADTSVTPQSCYVSGGQSCGQASFDVSPNSFGGTDDEITFNYNNAQAGSGGGSGFFFFQQGALGQLGHYTDANYPMDTSGYGNAGYATLDVTDTAPAPLTPYPPSPGGGGPEPSTWALMMVGVFGVGVALRRRGRAALVEALPA